ncbi:MAG: hypothetical protein WDW38_005222 [Sanguina aurantia]
MGGSGPNKTVLSGLLLNNIRKPVLKPAPVKQQQQQQQPFTAAEQIQVIIIEPASAQAIQPTQAAEPSSTAVEAEGGLLQPRGNSKDKQVKGNKAPASKAAVLQTKAAENQEQPTSTIAAAAAKAPDTAAKAARPQRRLAAKSREEGVQVHVIEDGNDGGDPLQKQAQQQQHQHHQQQQQDGPPYPQESPAEAAALDAEDHGMNGRAVGGVSKHDGDAAKPQQNKARRQTFRDGEEIFKHMQGLAESVDLLVEEPEKKKGRRKEKPEKDLRGKLHDSWNGMTYLERIEANNTADATEEAGRSQPATVFKLFQPAACPAAPTDDGEPAKPSGAPLPPSSSSSHHPGPSAKKRPAPASMTPATSSKPKAPSAAAPSARTNQAKRAVPADHTGPAPPSVSRPAGVTKAPAKQQKPASRAGTSRGNSKPVPMEQAPAPSMSVREGVHMFRDDSGMHRLDQPDGVGSPSPPRVPATKAISAAAARAVAGAAAAAAAAVVAAAEAAATEAAAAKAAAAKAPAPAPTPAVAAAAAAAAPHKGRPSKGAAAAAAAAAAPPQCASKAAAAAATKPTRKSKADAAAAAAARLKEQASSGHAEETEAGDEERLVGASAATTAPAAHTQPYAASPKQKKPWDHCAPGTAAPQPTGDPKGKGGGTRAAEDSGVAARQQALLDDKTAELAAERSRTAGLQAQVKDLLAQLKASDKAKDGSTAQSQTYKRKAEKAATDLEVLTTEVDSLRAEGKRVKLELVAEKASTAELRPLLAKMTEITSRRLP